MEYTIKLGGNAQQQGIALIFALLLLLVLTVIGVGTLSSVRMQERMAGNANLQALAFEAASAGVALSVDFWLDDDNSNWPTGASCSRGLNRDWATGWTTPPRQLNVDNLADGFVVQYRTRLGCFESDDWILLNDPDPDVVPVAPPVQLLVLSEGRVFRSTDGATPSETNPIATREIEVRLERRGGDDPDFCAINFCPMAPPPSGGDGKGAFGDRTLEMPNAKAFSINGGAAGCAAGFDDDPDVIRARAQLSENQLQRYQPEPGVVEARLRGTLNNPDALARAVNAIKVGIRAWGIWNSGSPDPSFGGSFGDNPDPAAFFVPARAAGSNPFANCRGQLQTGNLTSCPSGITGFHYIAGDVDMGPCTFRNFMIVEGNFLINGNPIYTDPLMVLGGTMETRGWGNSENSNIAIVQNLIGPSSLGLATPAYDPSTATLGDCRFRVAGGGTGALEITEDCTQLQEPWEELNSCLQDLADMSKVDDVGGWEQFDAGGNLISTNGSLFEYIQAIIQGTVANVDLQFEEIDLVDDDDDSVTLFSVPTCAGDPDAGGRRNVIASWREFIDQGRWDNVPPW